MAHAYTPGLKVSERTTLHVKRLLPIAGKVHVATGNWVEALDVVAEASIPGNVYPINLANQIGVSPGDVKGCMLVEPGTEVTEGQEIARSKGFFGFFKTSYHARMAGLLESVSKVTGQIILRGDPIPVQVKAYVPGRVIEVLPEQGVVIESRVSLIQGIFGIGNETFGPIRMVCERFDQPLTEDLITAEMRGAVLIGGARMSNSAVRKALEVGAAAIVSGGIDDQDLKEILGYDLGVAITGTETVGITLIVTEGFGDIGMAERTFRLLQSRAGEMASVNGATQIRAGVMRPEIVIPLPQQKPEGTGTQQSTGVDSAESEAEVFEEGAFEGILEPGTLIRIIRDPYFGMIGKVADLPPEPQVLGSGSRARVLEVDVDGQPRLTVPRANVEIIAG